MSDEEGSSGESVRLPEGNDDDDATMASNGNQRIIRAIRMLGLVCVFFFSVRALLVTNKTPPPKSGTGHGMSSSTTPGNRLPQSTQAQPTDSVRVVVPPQPNHSVVVNDVLVPVPVVKTEPEPDRMIGNECAFLEDIFMTTDDSDYGDDHDNDYHHSHNNSIIINFNDVDVEKNDLIADDDDEMPVHDPSEPTVENITKQYLIIESNDEEVMNELSNNDDEAKNELKADDEIPDQDPRELTVEDTKQYLMIESNDEEVVNELSCNDDEVKNELKADDEIPDEDPSEHTVANKKQYRSIEPTGPVSDSLMERTPTATATATTTSGLPRWSPYVPIACACLCAFLCLIIYINIFSKPLSLDQRIRRILPRLQRNGRRRDAQQQQHQQQQSSTFRGWNLTRYNHFTAVDLQRILREVFGCTKKVANKNKFDLIHRVATAYYDALSQMDMEDLYNHVRGKNLHPSYEMDKDQVIRLAVEAGF